MAHADYDCCAVCDSKMAYNSGDPRTKEDLCASCAVALARLGVFVKNGAQFVEWMRREERGKVLSTLAAVGFGTCFYPNPADRLYAELGGTNPPSWWKPAGAARRGGTMSDQLNEAAINQAAMAMSQSRYFDGRGPSHPDVLEAARAGIHAYLKAVGQAGEEPEAHGSATAESTPQRPARHASPAPSPQRREPSEALERAEQRATNAEGALKRSTAALRAAAQLLDMIGETDLRELAYRSFVETDAFVRAALREASDE
jgi:hypothetical protein